MNTKHTLALSVVVAAATFDAFGTELVPLEWSADGSLVKELAIPAGKFVETCGKLPAKAKVQWSFEADGPLDFNIHYHQGQKVLFPAKQNHVANASGTLDVRVGQDYCWMWTNKEATETSLRLKLAKR